MSVVIAQCGERPDKGDCTQSVDSKSTVTRTFFIKTSSVRDGPNIVLNAPILPQLFDVYQTQTERIDELYCVRRRPEKIGPTEWEVEVEYEVPDLGTAPIGQGGSGDVATWRQTVSLDFEEYDEPLIGNIYKDDAPHVVGNFVAAAVNSAGEPFNPPIVAKKYRPILTFTTYSFYVNASFVMEYVGAVNSDAWFGATERQLRIVGWTVPPKEEQKVGNATVRYYTHTIKMSYKRDTWDIKGLNAGSYYYDSMADTRPHSFATLEGHPYIGLLDANGGRLDKTADPTFRTFRYYREKPFGLLGLPAGFP